MPERYKPTRKEAMHANVRHMEQAREAEQDALLVVRHFNARLSAKISAGFWPTVATALLAKHHWLQILCESCGGVTDLDLRVKPRDPEVSIDVVLGDVRCPRCNGHGRPRIRSLARYPSIERA